ncbi:galactose-1-epimerase, partial [Pseudoalteromonas sp. S1727]
MSLQCVTQRLTAVHQSSASIKKFSRGIFAVAVSFGIALTPACAHQGDNMSNSPSALLHAYGKLADHTPINQVTLTNSNGVSVDVINYGGIITRIETPDSNGNMGNIVLGLDN